MQYFILLCILPPEIVNIIYRFILEDNAGAIICYWIKKYITKHDIISFSIHQITYHGAMTNELCNIGSNAHISALKYILANDYSKKIYDGEFWRHYLNLLSKRLMELYNKLWLYNKDTKKNTEYCNYKNAVEYWFRLCLKHNLYLRVDTKLRPRNISIGNSTITYVNSGEIKPIKNFNNFMTAPNILDFYDPIAPEDNYIYHNYSYAYLIDLIAL